MRHRIAIASLAAVTLLVGACEERDGAANRLATEPAGADSGGAESVHYLARGTAAVLDPRTHLLRNVAPPSSAPSGVSASIVAATTTTDAMQLPSALPGFGPGAGYAGATFDDSAAHHHTLILLYSSTGGPPVAMQHYIDGELTSVSAYSWQRLSTGWLRTRSLLRAVKGGTLYGTYTMNTYPVQSSGGSGPAQPVRLERVPPVGPFERVVGGVAYALAFALAPQDASAQYSPAFSACRQQWLKYAAAAAVTVGYGAVIVDAPVLTPLVAMQFAGSLALLAVAEDSLLDCVLANQPTRTAFGGGSGGGATGGGSSSDCLEGSYAAHCTTPFTL